MPSVKAYKYALLNTILDLIMALLLFKNTVQTCWVYV